MKKSIIGIIIFFLSSSIFAKPIEHLVFFGDSLSDNGNLYHLILKIIPKSPPYFLGRFSNGPTWAENLGKYYYDKYYIDYKIYAYGGATAIWHKPKINFIAPTNLTLEVSQYILDTAFRDKSKTLFVIWIGGNDYLFDQDANADDLTSKVTASIKWAIETLYTQGGRHFLVFNVPDLSRVPLAKQGSPEKLHRLSELHNQKLDKIITNLTQSFPTADFNYIDIFSIFIDVMQNPEKYNRKYNIHINNTTDSCWPGGYIIKNLLTTDHIKTDVERFLSNVTFDNNTYDSLAITNFIHTSPDISEAYMVGKLSELGVKPCDNADQYLFWDHIHPTQIVHYILAQVVVEKMSKQIN